MSWHFIADMSCSESAPNPSAEIRAVVVSQREPMNMRIEWNVYILSCLSLEVIRIHYCRASVYLSIVYVYTDLSSLLGSLIEVLKTESRPAVASLPPP